MIRKFLSFLFNHRKIIYTLFILITLAILALTMLPSQQLGQNRLFQYDKIGHFLMFFFWTLIFGLLYFSRNPDNANLGFILFSGAFFGIAIEALQVVLPFDRAFEFNDIIADLLGAGAATIVLFLIKKIMPPKN